MFRKKGVDDLCMAPTRTNAGLTDELQARLKAEIIYVTLSFHPFAAAVFADRMRRMCEMMGSIDQYR
jgi:hypothetical protein